MYLELADASACPFGEQAFRSYNLMKFNSWINGNNGVKSLLEILLIK